MANHSGTNNTNTSWINRRWIAVLKNTEILINDHQKSTLNELDLGIFCYNYVCIWQNEEHILWKWSNVLQAMSIQSGLSTKITFWFQKGYFIQQKLVIITKHFQVRWFGFLFSPLLKFWTMQWNITVPFVRMTCSVLTERIIYSVH